MRLRAGVRMATLKNIDPTRTMAEKMWTIRASW
jgi:hypothetical protein